MSFVLPCLALSYKVPISQPVGETSAEFSLSYPPQRPSRCLVANFSRTGLSLKASVTSPARSGLTRSGVWLQP